MTHTTESLMELRDLAEAAINEAQTPEWYIAEMLEDQGIFVADAEFIAALSPTKVIELLDAITELVAERDALKDQIDIQAGSIDAVQAANVRLAAERDTLRAQLDALQSEDELPRLQPIPFIQIEENLRQWAQSYAIEAQAMARAKLMAELVEERPAAWCDGQGMHYRHDLLINPGLKLYTRPQPSQDVNAELVEVLDETNGLLAAMLHEPRLPAEISEQMVLNHAALANAKAAQQKGGV